jgi:hypothetical protein
MATKTLSINNAQLPIYLLNPKYVNMIAGRNTGKSNIMSRGIDRMKLMPGSTATLTSASYKQIISNILPSALSYLERLGYQKDIHYFFKKSPPKEYEHKLPFEIPLSFEHYIIFVHKERCWGLPLVSMDRGGSMSGRGKNIDFELSDEFLTFNMDEYNRAVHSANRGNNDRGWEKFGWHHGGWHFSSMPYDALGRKMLDGAKYYETEFGIDYIGLWKKVVNLQLQLFEIEDPKDFTFQYNEMIQLKRQMIPKVSKDGLLFLLANALDNPQGGGFKWMKEQYLTTPTPLIFLIEVMNQIIDQVEDNYYFLDDRHEYKNAVNYDFIDSLGDNFKQIQNEDCRQDADRMTNLPLILSFDWGGRFSGMNVQQQIERKDIQHLPQGNFLHDLYFGELAKLGLMDIKLINFINEFNIKPPTQMIKHLSAQFIEYYKYHQNKSVTFINDTNGDHKRNTLKTWNEEFIDDLRLHGWNVTVKKHYGQEPPHDVVWKLINNILRETNPEKFPIFRFNSDKCKNTLISMKNTKVKDTPTGMKKDKSSENINSGVKPEHATHYSDSIGKFTFSYIPDILKKSESFIDSRIR